MKTCKTIFLFLTEKTNNKFRKCTVVMKLKFPRRLKNELSLSEMLMQIINNNSNYRSSKTKTKTIQMNKKII